MLNLSGGKSDAWTKCFPRIVNMQLYKHSAADVDSTFPMGGRQWFDAGKVRGTFTNVIVDLVSRWAADPSLTYVTPGRVHAALIQRAGTCIQALIYICCLNKEQ